MYGQQLNTDYCTVVLSVRGGNGSRISGTVATASGQGVNDVTVEFATNVRISKDITNIS
ncbi:MAG: hypothetical protein IPN46_12325 [Saprospiraceae bacterium]|nr:hypothetical protein [Saprospiraceae bacterium]